MKMSGSLPSVLMASVTLLIRKEAGGKAWESLFKLPNSHSGVNHIIALYAKPVKPPLGTAKRDGVMCEYGN